MARKSPIKHDVKQHTRNGKLVHHYERGSGKAPRVAIGRVHRSSGARFTVTLMGDKTESFTSDASGYLGALDSGINRASGSVQAIRIRRR